jgi:hypothetical protein
MNQRVALASPDRLQENKIKSECFQKPAHGPDVRRHGALASRRGETANEYTIVVGPAGHSEAIAQKSAAAQGTLWITREHGNPLARVTRAFDKLADKRALADSAAPRQSDDLAWTRGRNDLCEDSADVVAASDERKQSGQGQSVAMAEARKQVIKHGPPCSVH